MKPITQEWINKAEGNFSSAQVLLAQPKPNVDLVCFLSQQCIEMYLKACLQEANIFTPKTHLLPSLLDLLLPAIPTWKSMRPELKRESSSLRRKERRKNEDIRTYRAGLKSLFHSNGLLHFEKFSKVSHFF